MKLYEITQNYRDFINAIETGEIPDEAIADTLESIEGLFSDKADNIACVVKELESDMTAIKAEVDTLTERMQAKQNKANRLRQYLSNAMLATGTTSIETSRNKLTFRKSEAVLIPDEAAFIAYAILDADELLTYKGPTPDRTAIKAALKGGRAVNGATLEIRQNLQIK